MANDRFLSFLGLAMRAGKLSPGFDASTESVRKGESVMILTASDTSEKTIKELCFKTRESSVPVIGMDYTKDELRKALGRSVGIVSVNDRSFAGKLRQMLSTDTGEDTI